MENCYECKKNQNQEIINILLNFLPQELCEIILKKTFLKCDFCKKQICYKHSQKGRENALLCEYKNRIMCNKCYYIIRNTIWPDKWGDMYYTS